MKKRLVLLLIPIAVVFSFGYGFVSAQYKIFPHGLVKRVFKSEQSPKPVVQMPETGRWRLDRDWQDAETSKERKELLKKIAALPYLKGYNPAPEDGGVVYYDPERAYDGLNLYTSGHKPTAILLNMKGDVLHEWSIRFEDIWPDSLDFYENELHKTFWRRVHLFKNGDLLAIFEGIGMIKLDKDSNILWAYQGRCHHDLFVAEDGRIYTLTRKELENHDRIALAGPILEDFITILSPDGKHIGSISLLDAFIDSDYASTLVNMQRMADAFHTNTIEILDGSNADKFPMLEEGHALISVRKLHTIAVVDLDREEVTWALTGMWQDQHQPTQLDNGHLLIFDNLGEYGKSKVVEINPLTQEIVWSFRSTDEREFFSYHNGSNQRLPNGNTLITESDAGSAFEVTADKEIVWEFVSPHRTGDQNELIATVFEMIRLDFDGAFVPDPETD